MSTRCRKMPLLRWYIRLGAAKPRQSFSSSLCPVQCKTSCRATPTVTYNTFRNPSAADGLEGDSTMTISLSSNGMKINTLPIRLAEPHSFATEQLPWENEGCRRMQGHVLVSICWDFWGERLLYRKSRTIRLLLHRNFRRIVSMYSIPPLEPQ